MLEFVELVVGDFRNRGIIKTLDAIPEYVKGVQLKQMPLFRSYYVFGEDLMKYVEKNKTISGFEGIHALPEICLDIDKQAQSDEEVLEKARALVKRLVTELDVPTEQIYPYYSGTGYHVMVPDLFGFTPSIELSIIVKETLTSLFPECDPIFDQHRLIRVDGTLNAKSKLWKIALTVDELNTLTAAQILVLASGPREMRHQIATPKAFPLSRFIKVPIKAPEHSVLKSNPNGIVTCMQKLYNQGETQGSRHDAVLSMTSAFRRAGVPFGGILSIMQDWSPSLHREDPAEIPRLVKGVFDNDMRYSCSSPLFEKYCDTKCIYFPLKNYESSVVTPVEMEKEYSEFLTTDFSKTSFDFNEMYDLRHPYKVYPGELLVIIGDTGMGKTTLVQNWCVRLNKMKILYLSLEVHQHLLFRKFVQIANQVSKEQALDHYKNYKNTYSHSIDHIRVSTKAPTLLGLRKLIAEVQPQIVVVDTTDSIVMDRMHGLDKEDAQARGLKEIAQLMNIIIIGVHHIAKPDKMYGGMPLTVHSGKGSSSWEQKADKVISIEGKGDFRNRLIRSLKARDEAAFEMNTEIDWETFTIRQI